METTLLSVGVDIGTSTTSLVFSSLQVQNTAGMFTVPRMAISGKKLLYKSRIYSTPLLDEYRLDVQRIQRILETEYANARIDPSQVDTGAVIITGESAVKENAQAVLQSISRFAGDFVVATAGPELESVISGQGAGAQRFSKEHHCTVLNIDIGGGTSNFAMFDWGKVVGSSCYDIGGRLVKVNPQHRIYAVSPRLRPVLRQAGIELRVGEVLTDGQARSIARLMAQTLGELIRMNSGFSVAVQLMTRGSRCMEAVQLPEYLSLSGGVSQLLTHLPEDRFRYGDIGCFLAEAITQSDWYRSIPLIPAGVAAETDTERVAAKLVLSNLLVRDLRENPAVPYEEDDVTRMIQDRVDETVYRRISGWNLAELREYILSYECDNDAVTELRRGLTSEMIAGVTKLMTNLDLVYAAKKICVPTHCNTHLGLPGTMSTRLQPNHPTDDIEGITASLFEGLSYGCGDALIGLNPVSDTAQRCGEVLRRFAEVKNLWQIPTQICVLAHITTQMDAVRQGAPTDLIFQSIAGSEKGNEAFGFTTDTVREAQALLREKGTAEGPNVFYFETGQGSELSSGAHYGTDQLTMEARCYGFAKEFDPFIVNTVVGFIGPEYLYDSRQVIRAGLEDHFMAKLTGIPMGCDCCYTNHMLADQNDIENLTCLLGMAGCNYVIGVPASDDVMLNYQSNSYHDINAVRAALGLRPIRAFEEWLERVGIMENGKLTAAAGDPTLFSE